MLAIERKNKILEILQEERRVVVGDLSKVFNVTEETIRRDLEKLEREGLAKKTYGGAIINESLNVDLPYTVRKKANVASKQIIADLISDMIEDGDHIMLDASSTAVYVAKRIKTKKNITIITNSIEILLELGDTSGWKILSTGGTLKDGSLSLNGYQAERMINTFHVDKAIISCKGIDMERGITDSNELDAQIKKLMLQASNHRILAVDSSKFNKVSFTQIEEIKYLNTIVTDCMPDENFMNFLQSGGIELRCRE